MDSNNLIELGEALIRAKNAPLLSKEQHVNNALALLYNVLQDVEKRLQKLEGSTHE